MAQPSKHKKDSADESRPLLLTSQQGDDPSAASSSSQDREYYGTSRSSSPRISDRKNNKDEEGARLVKPAPNVESGSPLPSSASSSSSSLGSDSDTDEGTNIKPQLSFPCNYFNSPSSSSNTITPADQEQGLAPADPSSAHRHHHHRHRRVLRTPFKVMLSYLSQSGLFIFFGLLTAAIIKAPWVSPFSWHPICMGLYGFVSTQAILLLQPNLSGEMKEGGKTLHFFLLTIAFITSIFGFQAIWNNKELLGKEHFHTNHAYAGGMTLLLFLVQLLYGVVVGYAPNTIYGRIGKTRATRIHRGFGYFSITLLWLTLWLGVLTSWMSKNFDGYQWVFALSMGMVAVGTVGQITPSRLWLSNRARKRSDEQERSNEQLATGAGSEQ